MATSLELEWMLDASDQERQRIKDGYYDEPALPHDHPGFIDCVRCGVGVRADLFHCPACGSET